MKLQHASSPLLLFSSAALRQLAHMLMGQRVADLRSRLRAAYSCYRSESPPSRVLILALIAAEDHRFESHAGVDVIAFGRVLKRLLFYRTVEGASTIEQQLVRVLTGQRDRTISRKCRELLLTVAVAEEIPKADVPGLYLSLAYFGWGTCGYREAVERLGFSPDTLSPHNASELIARLKYPAQKVPSELRRRQIERRAAHIRKKLRVADANRPVIAQEASHEAVSGLN